MTLARMPEASTAAPRAVAIVYVAHLWRLQLELARRLREEQGCAVHFYCQRPAELDHVRLRAAAGVLESLSLIPEVLPDAYPSDLDEATVFAAARALEDELGLTVNRITMMNRHHGRGFALGGFRHPRSRHSEEVSYVQTVETYRRILAFWSDEVKTKRIDLLLNGAGGAIQVGEALGVACRSLVEARYKDNWLWVEGGFDECRDIEEAFADPATAEGEGEEINAPTRAHLEIRTGLLRNASTRTLLEKVASQTKKRLIWKLRGHHKAREYYYREEVAYQYRMWRDLRALLHGGLRTVKSLEGEPFVFFPLHVEPEKSVQILSPEFFFQLSAIAALARELPAGVKLIVKEHVTAVGRRPDNFYDQLREFRNVELMDPSEHGVEAVRASVTVATITSSAGMEAAIMGKPVITFGQHNWYNFLPHVRVIERPDDLGRAARELLSPTFDSQRARRDGARFLRALKAASFDLAGYSWRKPEQTEDWMVERAHERLLRSLRSGEGADVLRSSAGPA